MEPCERIDLRITARRGPDATPERGPSVGRGIVEGHVIRRNPAADRKVTAHRNAAVGTGRHRIDDAVATLR